MVGVTRALSLGLISLLLVTGTAPTGAAQPAGDRWYTPVIVVGKTFPVLLSASGRWLNWRDTYGAPRMRFINGTWQQVGTHQGIDIFAEEGTPVVSLIDGVVERAGWTFYSGLRVGVRGVDGNYWFYAHLTHLGPGIAPGARTPAGRVLGYMGNSGYGPEGTADEFPVHLHLGLQLASGRWVNPQDQLVALYDAYIARIEQANSRLEQLEHRRRLLAARLVSPEPPPHEAVASLLAEISAQRQQIQSNLMTGP